MKKANTLISLILMLVLILGRVSNSPAAAASDESENSSSSVNTATDKADNALASVSESETGKITVSFDQKEYSGNYTGEKTNGQPNGNGLFIADLEEGFFEYDGEWKNGEPTGNGKLKTSSYGLPISNNDLWYGEYQGSIQNGIASGFGVYTTQNSSGTTWSYTGEWENGVFNGAGKEQYANGTYIEGTFINGDFSPTPAEYYLSMASSFYSGFNGQIIPITEETKHLLKECEPLFLAHDIGNYQGRIDAEFQADEYLENPAEYDAAIIQLPGFVLQTGPDDVWGQDHAYAIFMTAPDTIPLLVLMHGHVSNSIKLYNVRLTAIPLGEYAYENPAGDKVRCVLCAGIAITAESRIG